MKTKVLRTVRRKYRLKNLVIQKLDWLANEIMLHGKLKLEIQENKNVSKIGKIFWKDAELLINEVDSKKQT